MKLARKIGLKNYSAWVVGKVCTAKIGTFGLIIHDIHVFKCLYVNFWLQCFYIVSLVAWRSFEFCVCSSDIKKAFSLRLVSTTCWHIGGSAKPFSCMCDRIRQGVCLWKTFSQLAVCNLLTTNKSDAKFHWKDNVPVERSTKSSFSLQGLFDIITDFILFNKEQR